MAEPIISDEDLRRSEREMDALWAREPAPGQWPSDPERVERILHRARMEILMSDTAGFLFRSFGVTLSGVARACFATLRRDSKEDPDSTDQPTDHV